MNWWFLGIWFVGFLVSYVSFIWLCVRDEGKITLADIGLGFVTSIFSWIFIVALIIMEGDKIIIWEKK